MELTTYQLRTNDSTPSAINPDIYRELYLWMNKDDRYYDTDPAIKAATVIESFYFCICARFEPMISAYGLNALMHSAILITMILNGFYLDSYKKQ